MSCISEQNFLLYLLYFFYLLNWCGLLISKTKVKIQIKCIFTKEMLAFKKKPVFKPEKSVELFCQFLLVFFKRKKQTNKQARKKERKKAFNTVFSPQVALQNDGTNFACESLHHRGEALQFQWDADRANRRSSSHLQGTRRRNGADAQWMRTVKCRSVFNHLPRKPHEFRLQLLEQTRS